jgi:hypothetical protein
VDVSVREGDMDRLVATIDSPRGRLELVGPEVPE